MVAVCCFLGLTIGLKFSTYIRQYKIVYSSFAQDPLNHTCDSSKHDLNMSKEILTEIFYIGVLRRMKTISQFLEILKLSAINPPRSQIGRLLILCSLQRAENVPLSGYNKLFSVEWFNYMYTP